MAVYYRKRLKPDTVPDDPALVPLKGLEVMKSAPVKAVFDAQEQPISLTRRVVATHGLKGAGDWRSTNAATGDHPTFDTEVVTARSKVDPTPGAVFNVSLFNLPSGWNGAGGGYEDYFSDTGGALRVDSVLDSNESTPTQFTTEAEQSFDSAEGSSGTVTGGLLPTTDGALWPMLEHRFLQIPYPDGLSNNSSIGYIYTKPKTAAEFTLNDLESPRVVDACVYETAKLIVNEADDDGSEWVHPSGSGPQKWPVQRHSETTPDGNPRGGTWHMMDVHHAQAKWLGPAMIQWSSFTQDGTAVTATEDSGISVTSTSFVNLFDSSITAYDSTRFGFSFGSGSYARNFDQNDETLVMGDVNGAIRCRLWVYGNSGSDSNTLVFRLYTADHSYIQVALASAANTWASFTGWLRCGVSPEQLIVAQPLVAVTAGTSVVKYFSLHGIKQV